MVIILNNVDYSINIMSQSHVEHPESTPTLKKTKLASPSLYEEINVFIKSALDSLKHMPEDTFFLRDILSSIGEHISQHQKSVNELNSEALTKSILFITGKCLLIDQKLREENKKSDTISTIPNDDILDKNHETYINDDFIKNMTSKIKNQLLENNLDDKRKLYALKHKKSFIERKQYFLKAELFGFMKLKEKDSYHSPYKNQFKFLRVEIMKYMNNNPLNKDICKNLEIFEEAIVKTTIYLKEALFYSIYDKIAESLLWSTDKIIPLSYGVIEGYTTSSIPLDYTTINFSLAKDKIIYIIEILNPVLENIKLIEKQLLNHHDAPQDIEMEREEIKRIDMQLKTTEKTLQESSQLALPSHDADIKEITSLTYKALNTSLEVYRNYIDQLGVIYSSNNVIPTEIMKANMDTTPQCWAETENDNVLDSNNMIT